MAATTPNAARESLVPYQIRLVAANLILGLILTLAAFLPWLRLSFGTNSSSLPIDLTPVQQAAMGFGSRLDWLPLIAGLTFLVLAGVRGLAHIGWSAGFDLSLTWLTIIAGWLTVSDMGLPNALAGHDAPGVGLIPQVGLVVYMVALVGCCIPMAIAVRKQ